jgi:hypothetical protein
MPDSKRFTLHLPPTEAEKHVLYSRGVLPPEKLQHGAHYSGEFGQATILARWHSKKRCFVYWHIALGRKTAKTAPHVVHAHTEEMFIPVAEKEPTDDQRISDYAFETTA